MKTADAPGPREGHGRFELDQQAQDFGGSRGKTALHRKLPDLVTTPRNGLQRLRNLSRTHDVVL